jgi:hypothetical protein
MPVHVNNKRFVIVLDYGSWPAAAFDSTAEEDSVTGIRNIKWFER